MPVHERNLSAANRKIAIVVGRFNDFVTTRLVSSAIDCIVRHGGSSSDVDVYWVPGSFEIPQLAMKIAESKEFDGIICLGTIIRGETSHFDNLSASVIASIAEIPARWLIPVSYGIVTADTMEQAMNRAGGKNGNKGWDSALAVIEMIALWEN